MNSRVASSAEGFGIGSDGRGELGNSSGLRCDANELASVNRRGFAYVVSGIGFSGEATGWSAALFWVSRFSMVGAEPTT